MTATLIRKVHIYAGLLSIVNFLVYGVVGIAAAFASRPGTAPPPTVVEREFTVPPNASDREVADQVCTLLGLTLARPIQSAAIQHDRINRLVLDFYHANGRHRVTVLEPEQKLRIEVYRASLWRYLGTLHVTTAAFHSGDWRMQLWADYNELAMWCLILMTVTGAYMGWLKLPAKLAWGSLAAGGGTFAVLYLCSR